MSKSLHVLAVLFVIMFWDLSISQTSNLNPNLPHYKKADTVEGNANSIGSDTMDNLMTLWLEEFRKIHPMAVIRIEGKGSSTAPPALIEERAQLAPMSRRMKVKEIDAIEKKFGFKPTEIRTALDAVAVFVNGDNSIDCLTLDEVNAIFSQTRKRGYPEDIKLWGELGLADQWLDKPIRLYGRNAASGTYEFFKEHVLLNGDFEDDVREQPGSASVIRHIAEDKFGIGYSGIGYKTDSVRIVPLAEEKGGECYEGTYENVVGGQYPLSRYLFVYVVKGPDKPLEPLEREFLRFVLSYEGQEIVVKDGYLPLPLAIVQEELKKIE